VLLYVINYVDRTNVGFAALTMNADLGFSPTVFGFGAGIFFVGYALFQVPANFIMERIGPRRWVFCILLIWGFLAASNALVETPLGFYVVRFALGIAEAGFFPGMLLYLSYWFPRAYLPRFTAMFMAAIPLSFVVGGPLGTLLLELDGLAGLHGWQWLFLLEGIPASLLAFAALNFLPDGPKRATWLTGEEKAAIAARLSAEEPSGDGSFWLAMIDPRVIMVGLANFAFQSGIYSAQLWLPQMLQAMGFSNRMTGLTVALFSFAGAGVMILVGRSSAMKGERIWHITLTWLVAAASFGLAGALQSDLLVLVAIAFGVVAVYGAQGPFFSLPSAFLRGSAVAAGIGLFNTFGNLGGFFGPTLIGVLTEGSGDYRAALMSVAIEFVLAVCILLGAARMLAARPLAARQTA